MIAAFTEIFPSNKNRSIIISHPFFIIDKNSLIPLQYLLIKIETSIEFLTNNSASLGTTAVEQAAKIPRDTVRMAIVVISTLPIILAYPFFQKYFVSGLTVGAVKE